MTEKKAALDDTLRKLYEVISFPEDGEPDWDGMKAVFHAKARFTRVTPEGIDYFDTSSFEAMLMEMLDRGVYTSFFEEETDRQVKMFGSVAHVLSAYQTKRSPEALGALARGINSIQLIWEHSSWSVLSLLWDEESEANPLHLSRVFEKEMSHGEAA